MTRRGTRAFYQTQRDAENCVRVPAGDRRRRCDSRGKSLGKSFDDLKIRTGGGTTFGPCIAGPTGEMWRKNDYENIFTAGVLETVILKPKSPSLATPLELRNTFSALMSRWTMFRSCWKKRTKPTCTRRWTAIAKTVTTKAYQVFDGQHDLGENVFRLRLVHPALGYQPFEQLSGRRVLHD